jgi:1-acyl-sn-glycerol-3-phosphate acyltransferase
MALLATAGRPITFVVTREVYDLPSLRWALRAGHCIPVHRGTSDVAAARAMLKALESGEALGLFPEGGIDERRKRSGHPGVGYLALKTGVTIVPASIVWSRPRPPTLFRSLLTPGRAVVHFGAPLTFHINPDPSHEEIQAATATIMAAIQQTRQLKV